METSEESSCSDTDETKRSILEQVGERQRHE
jgi:hypothetical protein